MERRGKGIKGKIIGHKLTAGPRKADINLGLATEVFQISGSWGFPKKTKLTALDDNIKVGTKKLKKGQSVVLYDKNKISYFDGRYCIYMESQAGDGPTLQRVKQQPIPAGPPPPPSPPPPRK